ncbi:MAG: peroxin [Vezdaea acicularis]|nr:MAG: peroxin [Vezdaea acicularis]
MIAATRNWFKRNRTNIAVGFGVVGAGYVATQYVLSKISEARERMSYDRIAKENLRRRFQQNQEDCTFTVLALLPTASENILDALPVENITHELQRQKAERLARTAGEGANSSEISSGPPSVNEDDGRSLQSFQSESYVHASQVGTEETGGSSEKVQGSPPRGPKKTKLQLWNELKISSITRALTLIYTLSLLTLLTRIQLNLLGRRSYLSSVLNLASTPPSTSNLTISLENNDPADPTTTSPTYGHDFETNRRYLTFSWWLLHRGWALLRNSVESAVKEVFGPLNLREDISHDALAALILEVRKRVEGATDEERRSKRWLPYLLPSPEEYPTVLAESGMSTSPTSSASPESTSTGTAELSAPLRRLLDETADLIDSPSFSLVHTLLLDASFTQLSSTLNSQAFKATSPTVESMTSRIEEVVEKKVKLATVLAVMTRQAHAIGNGGQNSFLEAMDRVPELEAFSAVVYASLRDGEVAEVEPEVTYEELKKEVEKEEAPPPINAQESPPESFVDVGTQSTLESAWGKAVEKSKGEGSP